MRKQNLAEDLLDKFKKMTNKMPSRIHQLPFEETFSPNTLQHKPAVDLIDLLTPENLQHPPEDLLSQALPFIKNDHLDIFGIKAPKKEERKVNQNGPQVERNLQR